VAQSLLLTVQAPGGPGLFLLGMIIMTGGLREMAGDAIRSSLSPTSGAVTGAISIYSRQYWPAGIDLA